MPGKELVEALISGVKYRLGNRIGQSGTSVVVESRAEDGVMVAQKIYRAFEDSDLAAMSDKISSEARMMTEWDSPWIVKGRGLYLPEDRESGAIMAMELMEKGSIERCVTELTPHQKVMALLSSTLAVDFIHGQKIVHGEIKPSNVLLDSKYHAKLSDFGAARAADGSTLTTIPVTMAYAALEVLDNESPTELSDIYSLGQVFCFVLTGKHSFDAKIGPRKLLKAVEAGTDVRLPGAKPELVHLIRSMMAVDPKARPESARAVFEKTCEHEFAFFEGIDPVQIRMELAKYGVDPIPFEPKLSRFEREVVTLKAEIEPLK
jgi:serine/threonine protein kinase